MADMLVKLYNLPAREPLPATLCEQGIEIRPARPNERQAIIDWVCREFSPGWAAECEAALGNRPASIFIAVKLAPRAAGYAIADEQLLGFACYDATQKGMFGPEGVLPALRGQGLGRALLLETLHAMLLQGYGYAVIGWAGPVAFYEKTVGATLIEGSEPGPYRGKLRG